MSDEVSLQQIVEAHQRQLVGLALNYEVKVYYPGGEEKSWVDLSQEIEEIKSYQPRHRKDGPCSTSISG